MTLRSNIYTDEEGVWLILDPQNREEWEAFWRTLLFQFEEKSMPLEARLVGSDTVARDWEASVDHYVVGVYRVRPGVIRAIEWLDSAEAVQLAYDLIDVAKEASGKNREAIAENWGDNFSSRDD